MIFLIEFVQNACGDNETVHLNVVLFFTLKIILVYTTLFQVYIEKQSTYSQYNKIVWVQISFSLKW